MPFFKNQIVKFSDPITHLPEKGKLLSRKGDYWIVQYLVENGATLTLHDDNLSPWTTDDDAKVAEYQRMEAFVRQEKLDRAKWSVFLVKIEDARDSTAPQDYKGRPGATGTLQQQWDALPIIPDYCLVLAEDGEKAIALCREELHVSSEENVTWIAEYNDEPGKLMTPLKFAMLDVTDKMREFDKQTERGWLHPRSIRVVTWDH